MIKASCDQAGFNIIDTPDPDLFTTLTTRGTWDAAIFGWSSSGLVASGESIYVTGGNQNYGGYTDPTVDSSWAEVVKTVDRAEGRPAEGADGAGAVDQPVQRDAVRNAEPDRRGVDRCRVR